LNVFEGLIQSGVKGSCYLTLIFLALIHAYHSFRCLFQLLLFAYGRELLKLIIARRRRRRGRRHLLPPK